jgi:pyruvate/2-oxoglutarate dehydrogenase complex dihydrolipoamide acyltransferase (E2) component
LTVAEEIPIKGIRKVIFNNLHNSLSTQAQLTLETEASAMGMVGLRSFFKTADSTKVSYNAILVKAVARSLRKHPRLNAMVDGEIVKVWNEIHVGLAMDLGDGLIVPKVGIDAYIGCCQPFFTKHVDDFVKAGLPGILLDIDNTTCYDLDAAKTA